MAEAKKKVEATKPTPEEKQAAAEAEVDALVARAKKALVEFENLDQKQVDRIVAKASIAALNKHLVLAKMAVDETGRGLVEDKATKNIFACVINGRNIWRNNYATSLGFVAALII